MSLRIIITGTTGDSMPPPYAGVPNVSLLYGRAYKRMGHNVAITFVYKPEKADDLGANAEYFFEYKSRPNKFKKLSFLLKYFFKNPFLYFFLLKKYLRIYPRLTLEVILYPAYGVFMNGVLALFKPDIILSQAALIKTFMVAEIARKRKIPIVFEPYAEIHDLQIGVNKHLDEQGRNKYWTYFLNLAQLVIGMDNCSVGPLMYLSPERVKVFYDTCDFTSYQVEIPETREELRDIFGLPHDCFLVGMMGAFHYRKGHDQLIKAVAILKRQGFNVGATIVGGPVGIEKWQALAKEEGVEDRIFLFQDFSESKKIRLYRCIDLYANLSNSTRSCGLDLALLEAMACGLPIVVYDNGALPGAVPNEENGLLARTNDINSVVEKILAMYQKPPEERKRMGEKSRSVASKTDINLTAKIKMGWAEEIINDFAPRD